jgi:tetratricopeptide (TPR) repeat protein
MNFANENKVAQSHEMRPYLLGFSTAIVLLAISALCGSAAADAKLYSTQGTVEVQRAGAAVWEIAMRDSLLGTGDTIRTAPESRAGIALDDGSLVRIGPSSFLTLQGAQPEEKETIFLSLGKLFFFSRSNDHTPEIRTPTVSAAIRGTEITVTASANETSVAVLDGQVECFNSYGSVPAGEGELVVTQAGKAPVKTVLVKPKEYVEWLLHVPPFLESRDDPSLVGIPEGSIKKLEGALASGDIEVAASQAASVPALQAIVAVINDDKAAALSAAQIAVARTPTSAIARLALAFALQAQGDIEGARTALEAEIQGAPSSYFLARRAELALAMDDVDAARRDAEASLTEARSHGTNQTYALTVLGFIAIVDNEPNEAVRSFTEAIQFDDSYPVAYLGRGLAVTQLGEAEKGASDIAAAVHLSPSTSVYRSYLGKALFELTRDSPAKAEFDRAIALDPNDPTPLLYRSFQSLAANDPVAALEDVTASAQRNGNRAVYRSSLLLDRDQATRKASLAETFAALGFGEVARVQALSSLTQDYTNFAAHRYLANAYNQNFQFESSRSERALTNLLAPLGFNSLQPIGQNSFGDYTTLFERNQQRTAISNTLDSQLQQVTASVTQSGRSNEWGYFVSGSGLYNDFAPSSVQLKDGLFSSAVQYQPNSSFRAFALAEVQGRQVRGFQTDNGVESDNIRRYAITTGGTLRLSPSTTLLSVAAFQHNNNAIRQPNQLGLNITALTEEGPFAESEVANVFDTTRQTPDQFQLSNQLLYHGDLVTLDVGHELFVSQVNRSAQSRVINDEFGIVELQGQDLLSSIDSTLQNHSVFAYSTWHLLPSLDLSVGGAYAAIESEDRFITPFSPNTTSMDRFNPKAAITWRPTEWATFRAGYIESLERTILEGLPSYEPSLVGAINQRYFDFPHTSSRNSTIAMDLIPAKGSYVGFEATHRDITLLEIAPTNYGVDLTSSDGIVSSVDSENRPDVHQDVDLLSSYWYQVLTSWLTSSAEYRYSLDNTFDPDRAFRIETHRGTLGLRAFSSSGFFLKGSTTYIDQGRRNGLPEENGTANGLLLDAGLGYRLAERHGIIELNFKNVLDKDLDLEPLLGVDSTFQSGFGVQLVSTFNF